MKKIITLLCCVAVTVLIAMTIMRFRPYILKSGSMEPTYKTGSLVIVDTHLSPTDVKINDVVVYSSSEGFVMHRYVGLNTLKGDANSTSQTVVLTEENLIGKPVFSLYLPGLSELLRVVVSYRYILLIAAAVLLVLSFVTSSASTNTTSASASSEKRSVKERSL